MDKTINLMEVCGTHTMAIARHGLRKLFPKNVKMLSGPGCPVCVTPIEDIDKAIEIGKIRNVILTTFGDMLHVPGSRSSLEAERAKGADIRVVYSPHDALDTAIANPDKEVVFVGVGFETTSPTIAATVLAAKKHNVKNFSVIPMFKTVPKALKAILEIKDRKIDGFLLPGHVSTIIGAKPYAFVAKKYGVPGVIGGFEPKDILDSVAMLVEMIKSGKPSIKIQYARSVTENGNKAAQGIMKKVFRESDANWRAIGPIPGTGYGFSKSFAAFDASRKFKVKTPPAREPKGCACGEILLGLKTPAQCVLFGKACSPAHAVGPCMVSSEGACAAAYKYGL
ncbi:MAG TPA: hydrogenase formation protein HypD [Elusimicrobia bacterium]|nr:hydrogenase formation protein HypD [Elusimicrobiota bacterium]